MYIMMQINFVKVKIHGRKSGPFKPSFPLRVDIDYSCGNFMAEKQLW